MNSKLKKLHSYPFEKLRVLLQNSPPINKKLRPINLSIGEPKHDAPIGVKKALCDNVSGISTYPSSKGDPKLRSVIAQWISRRHLVPILDSEKQILPVLGSREALFSFAQVVIEASEKEPIVVCPNPFYQIYEGASLLAGASPYYLYTSSEKNFCCDWRSVPEKIWSKTQLLFICSPANPTGNVMNLDEWKTVFELSDRFNFIIASDECYSEIYLNEDNPPLGALTASYLLGRKDYHNLVIFSSLSKRSNLPGLRSGFVAGDDKIMEKFLLYRTYHGSAMSPMVSEASIFAWQDEIHVKENRAIYREKFDKVIPILEKVLSFRKPQASFYLWIETPISDSEFTKELYKQTSVIVLPGSFLTRKIENDEFKSRKNYIRIALVASMQECVEASERILQFMQSYFSLN